VVYTHLPPHEAAPLADLLAAHALLLVAVDEPDWETHFSPWPAPKVFKGSADFGGLADAYLGTLTHEIVPAAEAAAGIAPQWRGLAGYSLAGLLSVYAPYQTDIFSRTASVSGSLWFDGLADFLQHAPPTLPERAYFSVGDREKNSKNPRLACVETRTQAAQQLMQARGASSIFELNPGGHFEHVPARMARAVEWLLA
jgi:predicted alpha/beta superfamily hydrolase